MSDVKVCLHDSVPGIEIHNNVQSFLPGIYVHCTPAVVIVVFSNGKLLCHGRTYVDLMLDQMLSQTIHSKHQEGEPNSQRLKQKNMKKSACISLTL